jgi:hypothetical protein
MEEIINELHMLKEEIQYIRDQIDMLKGKEQYNVLIDKYKLLLDDTTEKEPDKIIEMNGNKYTLDSNHFMWDEDGYFFKVLDDT